MNIRRKTMTTTTMTTVNKFYDEIEINELCFFPFALINN